jgi:cytochrome d ubiquinol oxidase subunit I
MCITATGAFYLLKRVHHEEARFMMKWGLSVTAILIVTQIIIGDINGKHMYTYQPAKFAAVEARWHPEHPGRQLWFAIPDEKNERNLFEITTPYLGSWFATGSWSAPVSGLSDFPKQDHPPVLIVFFAFRAMVGIGLFMLGISLLGLLLLIRGRLEASRWFLWASCLAFPTGFVAVLLGWFTTEIGRQPWVVYGLLRTADTLTPTLSGASVLATLIGYVIVYSMIFFPGAFYVYGLLRQGPSEAQTYIAAEALTTGTTKAKE